MRVALVHELLTMRGGAERVLRVLADLYPEAPIYTLLYDERKLGDWFPASRVRPSRLQQSARFSKNHHLYLSSFPKAVEAWDFSEFDLVISSSSAFTHGIITNSSPRHLCYVHAPARYLWDRTHEVLGRAGKGLLGPLRRAYLSPLFHRLRVWDSEAADRPDALLAPSRAVQRRIKQYWRRESDVLHPPLDDFWMEGQPAHADPAGREYYAVVSTLADYKRIDVAIRACNERTLPLKIAGDGPAYARLRSIAGPTVRFLGRVEGDDLRTLYSNAKATLFPGDEDFGLVPLESLASGTPVIALNAGGALETIHEGKTGTFFDTSEPASMLKAMDRLEKMKIDPKTCAAAVRKFSRKSFEDGIRGAAKRCMER
jgi:glycosyltransferase involved in cell wall biosynthesis